MLLGPYPALTYHLGGAGGPDCTHDTTMFMLLVSVFANLSVKDPFNN